MKSVVCVVRLRDVCNISFQFDVCQSQSATTILITEGTQTCMHVREIHTTRTSDANEGNADTYMLQSTMQKFELLQ